MARTKTPAPARGRLDFAALSVLIDTASRNRPSGRPTSNGHGKAHSPVTDGLMRGTATMSAREYMSARMTMARLLAQVKSLREVESAAGNGWKPEQD